MPELRRRGGPKIWFETRGESSDEPLMLLHGFTGTHRTWDPLAARLERMRFLILPDLPGHGRSVASTSIAKMGFLPTSEALVDVLRLTGEGRAALLGYSLGGRLALTIACRRPDFVSRLVLEGASPGLEDPVERTTRRESDRALADEIESRGLEWFVDEWEANPLFATQRRLPRTVVRGIRRDRLSNSGRGLAMSLRATGAGEMDPLWGGLADLSVPVLIIVGEQDRKYAEIGEAMHKRIPGSRLAVVEGAGHCPHVESPGRFAELVEGFLEQSPDLFSAEEPPA